MMLNDRSSLQQIFNVCRMLRPKSVAMVSEPYVSGSLIGLLVPIRSRESIG